MHDAYHGAGIDYEWDVGNGHLSWLEDIRALEQVDFVMKAGQVYKQQ